MPQPLVPLQAAKRSFMLGLVEDAEERRPHTRGDEGGSQYAVRLRPTTADPNRGKDKLRAFTAAGNTSTPNVSSASLAHRDVSSIAYADSHTVSAEHIDPHISLPVALRLVGRAELVSADSYPECVKQAEMRAHIAVLRQEVHSLTQSLIDSCGADMFDDLLAGSSWDPNMAADANDGMGAEDRQAMLVANGDYLLRQYRIEMDAQDAKRAAEEREAALATNLKRLSSLSNIHQGAMERAKELQKQRAAARDAGGEGKENITPASAANSTTSSTGKAPLVPRLKLRSLEERAAQASVLIPPPTPPAPAPKAETAAKVEECVSAIDQIRAQVMIAHIMQAAEMYDTPAHGVMVDRSAGSSNRSNLTPMQDSSMFGGGMHMGGVRSLPTRHHPDASNNSDLGVRQQQPYRQSRSDDARGDAVEPSPPRGRSTSPLSPMTTSILKRNSSSSGSRSHHKSTTSSSTPHSSNRGVRRVVVVGDGDDSAVGNSTILAAPLSQHNQRSDMFGDSSVVMLDNSVRSRHSSSKRGDASQDEVHQRSASTINTEDRYKAYGMGGPVPVGGGGGGDMSDDSGSDMDPTNKSSSSSRPVVRRTGGWGLAEGGAVDESGGGPASNTSRASSGVEDEVQEMSVASFHTSSTSSRRPQPKRAGRAAFQEAEAPATRQTKRSWSLLGCFGGDKKNGGQVAN